MTIGLTDRSCFVLKLAGDEADVENVAHVGSMHILTGLMLEGTGIAARVLRDAGLTTPLHRAAHRQWRRLRREEYDQWLVAGQRQLDRLAPDATEVLRATEAAATATWSKLSSTSYAGGPYIGTEHLLLGILQCPQCDAAKSLRVRVDNQGLSIQALIDEVYDCICGDGRQR